MALQAAAVCWDRLQAALFCPNCSKCLDAMGRHIFLRNTSEPSLSAAKSAQSLWPCWTAIFKGLQPPGSREAKLKMLLVIKSSRLRVWLLSAAAWMRHFLGVLLIGTTVIRDEVPPVSQNVSSSQATNPADSGGWKWWQHTAPPTAKTKNNYLYSTHHKTTHFTEKHRRKAWHTCFSAIIQPVAWVQLDTSRCAESAQIPLFAVWSQMYKGETLSPATGNNPPVTVLKRHIIGLCSLGNNGTKTWKLRQKHNSSHNPRLSISGNFAICNRNVD